MQRCWKVVACCCALVGLLLSSACGQAPASSTRNQAASELQSTGTRSSSPADSPTSGPASTATPAGVLLSGRAPFGGLRGPFSLNLDTGKASASADQGDFYLVVGTAPDGNTPRYCAVVSLGKATFALLGQVDFNSVTLNQLKQANYGQTLLRCYTNAGAANQLPNGTVFAVLTNGHHYAKVLVESNNFTQALAVTFEWVTFK